MKKLFKTLLIIIALLIAFSLAVYLFLKNGLTKTANTKLSEQTKQILGVDSGVEKVSIDLLNNNFVMNDFNLRNPENFEEPSSFFIKNTYVSFDKKSLLKGVGKLNEINIDGIKLSLVRNKEGKVNWLIMQGNASSTVPKAAEAKKPETTEEETVSTGEEVTTEKETKEETEKQPSAPVTKPEEKLPPFIIEDAKINALLEFIDHSESRFFERLGAVLNLEIKNLTSLPSNEGEWGTITITSHAEENPQKELLAANIKIAPIEYPLKASFDMEGHTVPLPIKNEQIAEKMGILSDSIAIDAKIKCRDGVFDRSASAINIKFENPKLVGKLAKKAKDINLPSILPVTVPLGGTIEKPEFDYTSALIDVALKTYVSGKIEKEMDKAVDKLFKSLEKLAK